MKHLKQEEFDDAINSEELSVIDFFATWCMPCRMLRPILEKIEKEQPNVKFYELDVQESEQIAMRYRIFSVPTVVTFKKGKKVDSMVGLSSYEETASFIQQSLKTKVE